MTKLLPFPAQEIQEHVSSLIELTAAREELKRPEDWSHQHASREALGNMLQRLAWKRPVAVLVLEHVVANLLAQLEP